MSWFNPRAWVGGPEDDISKTKSLIERTLDGMAVVRTGHPVGPTPQQAVATIDAELEKLDKVSEIKENELRLQTSKAKDISERMRTEGRASQNASSHMRQYKSARSAALATEQALQTIDVQRSQLLQQKLTIERKIISESTETAIGKVSLTMSTFKDATTNLERNMDTIEDAADSVEDVEAVMDRPLGNASAWQNTIEDEMAAIYEDPPIQMHYSRPVKAKVVAEEVSVPESLVDFPDVPTVSPPARPPAPVLAEAFTTSGPEVRVVRDRREIERLKAAARHK